jgi:hypothetical protein
MRPAVVLLAAAVAAAIAGWASDVVIRHSARGRRKATLTTVHRMCRRPWTAGQSGATAQRRDRAHLSAARLHVRRPDTAAEKG